MTSAPLRICVQEPAAAEKPPAAEKPAGKAGGVYIPPFKLAQMLREAKDETSAQYQRLRWDALRKSLNGLINKVNKENIKAVLPEIFGEVGPLQTQYLLCMLHDFSVLVLPSSGSLGEKWEISRAWGGFACVMYDNIQISWLLQSATPELLGQDVT